MFTVLFYSNHIVFSYVIVEMCSFLYEFNSDFLGGKNASAVLLETCNVYKFIMGMFCMARRWTSCMKRLLLSGNADVIVVMCMHGGLMFTAWVKGGFLTS